jgi:hypothetical protein
MLNVGPIAIVSGDDMQGYVGDGADDSTLAMAVGYVAVQCGWNQQPQLRVVMNQSEYVLDVRRHPHGNRLLPVISVQFP